MTSALVEAAKDAGRSLRANALRSALTMLGVTIGAAALVAMLAIGAGAQARVAEQIASLGANVLVVFPERRGAAADARARPLHLNVADAAALAAEVPGLIAASPAIETRALAVSGARNWATTVTGTDAAHLSIRDWDLTAGRIFSAREEQGAGKVALIGATVAARLFGATNPLGREIRVRNAPLTVIGVLAAKGQSRDGRDQDDAVFTPYATARLRLGAETPGVAPGGVGYILAKAASEDALEPARRGIEALLRQRHRVAEGVEPGFRVSEPTATIALQRDAASTIGWLLAAIAAIATIVGGVGILNIMLVSVTERTREIGLRLALGARRRDIARLFLIEALLLCLGGGAVGVALGVAAAWAIAATAGWPVLIAPETPLAAVGFATAVGVTFGYFPARKAAALHPADALRSA